jgi:hypothetical protein
MSRYALLVALAIAAGVAAIGVWWWNTFEPVEKEIDLPLRGEARFNPLLALRRTLVARGFDVHTRSHLNVPALHLGPRDVLVLTADVRTLSQADATALNDWVADGGRLVFALPPGADESRSDLLDAFGITATAKRDCLRFEYAAGKVGTECFALRFFVDADVVGEPDWTYGNEDEGLLFARQSYGDGLWFAASDLDFLDNESLDERGSAALAWQVLAPALDDARKVWLVYAADVPPWYVLLVRHGWPLVVPALIALLAWLWARSQRLGPVLPLGDPDRRALLEHVQAAGEFVFRRGRAIALYAALRRAFMTRLRRRDPALAALDGEALVQALAARTKRAAADVRQALHPVDIGRPERFLASIRTLTELRRDL